MYTGIQRVCSNILIKTRVMVLVESYGYIVVFPQADSLVISSFCRHLYQSKMGVKHYQVRMAAF